MHVRFYVDPEGDSHAARHGVSEAEIIEALGAGVEDRPASDGARSLIGRTGAGRLLRVLYVPDEQRDSVFVLTAYELGPKARRALRRRMRRRS